MPAARKHAAPKVAADPVKADAEDFHPQALVVKSSWFRDTAERVLFTFAQAFLGVFGATQIIDATSGHLDVSVARMALAAGIAAVLALVKAAIAAKIGGTVSPASLAPRPAPEPVDAEAGYTPIELLVGVLVVVILVLLVVFLAHQV